MTSRESIIETAENLGFAVLSGTGSALDRWRELRIELDDVRVLCVSFTQLETVREAVIEHGDGTRRAIRPANVGIIRDLMRLTYGRQHTTPVAPASAPGRGLDAFDEIERSDAAAARFERDPRNVGSIPPRVPPKMYTVTVTTPGEHPSELIYTGQTQPQVHKLIENAMLYRLIINATPEN